MPADPPIAPPRDSPRGLARAAVYGVTIAMAALVLWPAFREPPQDSFPLSDYPMFSYGRPDARFTISQALGVRDDGSRVPLPPIVSSANREVLQSMMTIDAAVRGGPERLASFCAEVAARVVDADDDDLEGVRTVEIATSTFDALIYFETSPTPLDRRVHVSCPVNGAP